MFWTINKGRYQIIGKNVLNNSQDTILMLDTTTLVANIIVQGIMMKEEPNAIFPYLKFSILILKSSFINICDSSDEDDLTLLDVTVPIYHCEFASCQRVAFVDGCATSGYFFHCC
jgi:hypothetical protein